MLLAGIYKFQLIEILRKIINRNEPHFDIREWALYDAETFEMMAALIRREMKSKEAQNGQSEKGN